MTTGQQSTVVIVLIKLLTPFRVNIAYTITHTVMIMYIE